MSRASWSLALKSAAVSVANAVASNLRLLADGGDELTGAVDEQRTARVRLVQKVLQRCA